MFVDDVEVGRGGDVRLCKVPPAAVQRSIIAGGDSHKTDPTRA